MGVTGSSSKRKSSKTKSSKLSHQARRKKKKSRREKSKKLRRRDDSDSSNSDDDSDSSNSDDDSFSSMSLSSYSSEDDYKSQKGRSRRRSEAKSRRKKVRKRSSSVESREDLPRSKKRKRSKKDVDSRSKKKSRKKIRRDVSVSSASGNSSSEESEFERRKGRLRKTNKDKRDRSKVRSKTRRSKSRSSSCSSVGRYSNHSGSVSFETLDNEEIVGESKSRRLRSVITFVEQPRGENKNVHEKDSYKEEIDYDRDDYPSSRSNDSNGEGGRRDFGDGDGNGDVGDVKINNLEKENKSEILDSVSGADNLELILRQKALENLSKFRGERKITGNTINQKNEKDSNTDFKQASSVKAKNVQEISSERGGLNEVSPMKEMGSNSIPTLTRNSTHSGEVERNISDERDTAKDSKRYDVSSTLEGNFEKEENNSSVSRLESPSTGSSIKQERALRASHNSNILATKSTTRETTPSTSQYVKPSDNSRQGTGDVNVGNTTSKESTSCSESTPGESSSKNQEGGADGGQFKEKTMSVMRGGEMVQVSYKVYIPKKAPALARRQLNR